MLLVRNARMNATLQARVRPGEENPPAGFCNRWSDARIGTRAIPTGKVRAPNLVELHRSTGQLPSFWLRAVFFLTAICCFKKEWLALEDNYRAFPWGEVTAGLNFLAFRERSAARRESRIAVKVAMIGTLLVKRWSLRLSS